MSDSKDGWNADFQQHFTDEDAEVQGQAGVRWPLTAQARSLHCFGSPLHPPPQLHSGATP